jgi:hypothetical protein
MTHAWPEIAPWIAGVLGAAILPIITWKILPRLLVTDGAFSTSKLQLFLWTEAVAFSYAFLFAAHTAIGEYAPDVWCTTIMTSTGTSVVPCKQQLKPADPNHKESEPRKGDGPAIPDNLLILMGLAITTRASSGLKNQPWTILPYNPSPRVERPVQPHASQFLTDAGDDTSLAKFQMLSWTIVAIGVYLYTSIRAEYAFVDAVALSYPNVDTALTILVGLGQGGFVVNRFINPRSTD